MMTASIRGEHLVGEVAVAIDHRGAPQDGLPAPNCWDAVSGFFGARRLVTASANECSNGLKSTQVDNQIVFLHGFRNSSVARSGDAMVVSGNGGAATHCGNRKSADGLPFTPR